MSFLSLVLLAQRARPARQTPLVLAFPEPGLDDSAAYAGYQTRFYRDAAANTVQIYLNGREGRVVTLLADAENASIGFSARDGARRHSLLRRARDQAGVAVSRRPPAVEDLPGAHGPVVNLGSVLLRPHRGHP